MKKFILAAGFVIAATSAAIAQGYGYQPYGYGPPYGYGAYAPGYGAPGYGAPGVGIYDAAPGYGVYDFSPGYGNHWYEYDRVDGPGRGNSAESQR